MSIYRKLLGQALAKAVGGSRSRATVAEQLMRLQPGMTRAETKALIGEPDKVKSSNTAGGHAEEWNYSGTTLISNVRGIGAAMGLAFTQGLNDQRDQQLILRFDDGVLSAIEGLSNASPHPPPESKS